MSDLAGVLRRHAFEILDKGFLATRHFGIVLDVLASHVLFDRSTQLALIKHQVVERLCGCFVMHRIIAYANSP